MCQKLKLYKICNLIISIKVGRSELHVDKKEQKRFSVDLFCNSFCFLNIIVSLLVIQAE